MSLQEKISGDIIAGMKAKEALRVSVLRMVKAAMTNFMIEKKKETLTDAEVVGLIQKQVKQRKESLENYQKGGRKDLADKEQQELEILAVYLPQQMSAAEIETLAKKAIETTQAKGKADMGKVMKALMPDVQGRADGKDVSTTVNRLLGA